MLFSEQRAEVHKKLYAALQRYDPKVAKIPWGTFYDEIVALELAMLGFVIASTNTMLAVAISLLKNSELQQPGRNKIAKAEAYYNEQTLATYSHTGMSGYAALTTLFLERLGAGSSEVAELIEADLGMLAKMLQDDMSRYRFV